MSELEVRIDHLRPREVAERMAAGPVAWIPLGAVEYHAEHLPLDRKSTRLNSSH